MSGPIDNADFTHDRESDWRMQLNNYLQGNGGTKMLSWEVYPSGPSHEVVWTATVFSKSFILQLAFILLR